MDDFPSIMSTVARERENCSLIQFLSFAGSDLLLILHPLSQSTQQGQCDSCFVKLVRKFQKASSFILLVVRFALSCAEKCRVKSCNKEFRAVEGK